MLSPSLLESIFWTQGGRKAHQAVNGFEKKLDRLGELIYLIDWLNQPGEVTVRHLGKGPRGGWLIVKPTAHVREPCRMIWEFIDENIDSKEALKEAVLNLQSSATVEIHYYKRIELMQRETEEIATFLLLLAERPARPLHPVINEEEIKNVLQSENQYTHPSNDFFINKNAPELGDGWTWVDTYTLSLNGRSHLGSPLTNIKKGSLEEIIAFLHYYFDVTRESK